MISTIGSVASMIAIALEIISELSIIYTKKKIDATVSVQESLANKGFWYLGKLCDYP